MDVAVQRSVVLTRRWYFCAALVVLNVADLIATRLALSAGAQERNPLLAPFVGNTAGSLVKTLGIGTLALSLLARRERSDRTLVLVVSVYAGVVVWNLGVYLFRTR